MTAQEALSLVDGRRRELRIAPDFKPVSAEKSIVEYTKNRQKPGPVENRIAWVVTLGSSLGFVQVHVEDRSGEVLEVIRSA